MGFFKLAKKALEPKEPSVSGGYTFSPSAGLIPTDPIRSIEPVSRAQDVAPAAQQAMVNPQSLADYLNTYANTSTVDWGSIGPALQKLGIGQNGRDGSAGWQFNNNIDAGNVGWTLTPEAAEKLAGWTVGDPRLQGETRTQQIKDAGGQTVGTSQEDMSRNLLDTLGPMLAAGGMAYFGVPALGGLLGGGVLGGAAAGAGIGGATAAAQGNDIGKGLLMGGIGGGISGAMGGVPASGGDVAGLDPFTPDSLKAWGQSAGVGVPDWESAVSGLGGANPLEMGAYAPDAMRAWAQSAGQGVPDWESPIAAPTAQPPSSGLDQFRQQEINSYQTDGRMPSPAVPEAPPTTGLSDFRADELKGYQTDGRLPSSPAVPTGTGGLLGTLKGAGSGALDWMKANPGLAKMLIGGAAGLLGSQGGASGGAAKQYGPAVQWKSPVAGIPQGLLGGGQSAQSAQGYPAALGLLGGQPNAGAWRFLR